MKIPLSYSIVGLIFVLVIVGCDTFPEEQLIALGVSEGEISFTKSINGNNGYDDVYIVYRDNRDSLTPKPGVVATSSRYDLYEADTLRPLIKWSHLGITTIELLEISNDQILLVLSHPSLGNRALKILVYDRNEENFLIEFNGEIPCFDFDTCDWFNTQYRKLAFIAYSNDNPELLENVVYQFDWSTHNLLEIRKSMPFIDAGNRRIDLVGLYYDRTRQKYRFGQ